MKKLYIQIGSLTGEFLSQKKNVSILHFFEEHLQREERGRIYIFKLKLPSSSRDQCDANKVPCVDAI